ncbi:CubicO group peptidase (beta-lactamase class C family) [Kitasatospora sp. MAA4]|uniref:serine hydrolase domain-containing protein n=1 Tax=Kitasatospora sp. MAA4 TaxID=3035093 RepID=UPI00247566FC|nr:serine hydrolase domain-containing protein [Kitasatospora sp. MAA4]MDH6132164.1 CubicO group peptidase (beta-lactamase class C family) [Kitasatospora sp. MAA4]
MAHHAEELLPTTSRALLHRLAVAQAEGRTPSLVGAVVRGGRTVWTGSRSMIDDHAPTDDVQYRIGSISKTFAAVLVLRLRDEGLLDLSDPLERHLPGTSAGDLTIHQLLTHTSGLASETPEPWWERTVGTLRPELADVLGEQPVRHPAGRRHHYSNPGYALLGALVEQLRGEPWGQVLQREVLDPLGMTRTSLLPQMPHAGGFAVHPWADVMLPEPLTDTAVMAPAGQLWSTAADLCRWAAFLSAGDEKVLSPATVAEMRRPTTEPDGEEWTSSYGLGLQVIRRDGRVLYGHSGSMPGFLAWLWVSEADDVAAVVLTNTTSGSGVATVAGDLIRIVAEHEPRIPEPWRPMAEADPELLALTGPWYWGPTALALRLGADRRLELIPLGGPARASRFRPEADGSWTGLDGYYAGETLRVVRAADGTVSHLDIGSFVLTRAPYGPGEVIPGGVDPQGWQAF